MLSRICSVLVLMSLAVVPLPTRAQSTDCDDYDNWEWAQAVFESDPLRYTGLDRDVDGEACPDLPRGGLVPAFWTERIPRGTEEATIVRVIDGDTLEVLLDGGLVKIRVYRADTPETQNENHCGGHSATDFAFKLLMRNDNGTEVELERDSSTTDRYGRHLAYVWFETDGQPYMYSHALISMGWAADTEYGGPGCTMSN